AVRRAAAAHGAGGLPRPAPAPRHSRRADAGPGLGEPAAADVAAGDAQPAGHRRAADLARLAAGAALRAARDRAAGRAHRLRRRREHVPRRGRAAADTRTRVRIYPTRGNRMKFTTRQLALIAVFGALWGA